MRNAAWYQALITYPCATCGATPGQDCTTKAGKWAFPHADRTNRSDRCPRCGEILDGGHPGALCRRCALVRALEIERATKHRRET